MTARSNPVPRGTARAVEDAERAAGSLELPVVCFRRSRSGWFAALPLGELLALLRLRDEL